MRTFPYKRQQNLGCESILNTNMWHLQEKFFYEIISGSEIYPRYIIFTVNKRDRTEINSVTLVLVGLKRRLKILKFSWKIESESISPNNSIKHQNAVIYITLDLCLKEQRIIVQVLKVDIQTCLNMEQINEKNPVYFKQCVSPKVG